MIGQVNGVYDITYFSAEGNEYSNSGGGLWWSSRNEVGGASDYLEINLGKRRSLNYMSFDVIKKPIDIEIQYDSVDLDNIDEYSDGIGSRWRSVKPVVDQLFDHSVSYESNSINPWKHCEFYFLDQEDSILETQRIRIKFTRRTEDWPTKDFPQFPYSIDVNNFRVGRYVSGIQDVCGSIIDTKSFSDLIDFSSELRQRFIFPDSAVFKATATTDLTNIGLFLPTDIVPRMKGFEILVEPSGFQTDVVIDWKFVDVTNYDIVLSEGRYQKTTAPSPSGIAGDVTLNTMPEWLRVSFDTPVVSEAGHKYEIRIRNLTPDKVKNVCSVSPNPNNQFGSPEDNDVYAYNNSGALTRLNNQCLTYRVLSEVGNLGKDLLGNEYREGVRYNSAEQANDGKIYTNWTNFPNPSSEGVEALYFDIRKIVDGSYRSAVIDTLEVNTLTPGVRMNVYFSRQELGDHPPQNIDDWENILWTPVRQSFKLNQKQMVDFPYPVAANWICLEFYNLQPVVMNLPNYPILPGVTFKEFPDWVYSDNPGPQPTSDNEHLQQEKFVSFKIHDVFAPKMENNVDTRIYAPTKQTLDQNIDANGFGTAQSNLLGKISFSKNPYSQPSIYMSDTSSTLGSSVYDKYVNDYSQTYISEAKKYPRLIDSRSVSNTNNRFETTRSEELSLLFNRVCSHQYSVKRARYNKKSYTVSISEIRFLRKDYSVKIDDPIIHDVLVYEDAESSPFIEYSTWQAEQKISMPVGDPIFVTYTVGGQTYEDEIVYFESPTSDSPSYEPVDLIGSGSIATSVIARSGAFKEGSTYYRDQDFVIAYDAVSKKNKIKRDDIPARLVIPNIINSVDKYTAHGFAILITKVMNADEIELGAKDGQVLSTGQATVSGDIQPPIIASSSGATTIYAVLTNITE